MPFGERGQEAAGSDISIAFAVKIMKERINMNFHIPSVSKQFVLIGLEYTMIQQILDCFKLMENEILFAQ